MSAACFRFYAELNNFLAPAHRQRNFRHPYARDASVKHMIEALGVPHTEVDLILVDGVAVDFSHRLRDGQSVSIYPAFSGIDVVPLSRLRPPLGDDCRFIADAHLGLLARQLRMLGFDVLYRNDYSDAEVARISADDGRAVLTRDRDLLIRKEIVHGCYLHAIACDEQVAEVLHRYRLARAIRPFSRCLNCNGMLRAVAKDEVAHRVPPYSRQAYEHFYECQGCAQVYWEGSHVNRMRARMGSLLGPNSAINGAGYRSATMNKLYSAACERNRDPILAVLRDYLSGARKLLEIGSGTGQHAAYFAAALPRLVWQTSDIAANHPSITAWADEARLPNLPPPLLLDVGSGPWPPDHYDAVFSANTCHIMDWDEVRAMFAGIAAVLDSGGIVCIYGPFNYNGEFTSDSNSRFDAMLRMQAPHMGIRDFEEVDRLARQQGMTLLADHSMPANNRLLIWRKS